MDNQAAINRVSQMTVAERQDEERRQVQVLSDAIQAVIIESSRLFDVPMMNAVSGALVTAEASMLAAMSPDHRKMIRKAMDKARPGALALALARSPNHAQVVKVRRHDA